MPLSAEISGITNGIPSRLRMAGPSVLACTSSVCRRTKFWDHFGVGRAERERLQISRWMLRMILESAGFNEFSSSFNDPGIWIHMTGYPFCFCWMSTSKLSHQWSRLWNWDFHSFFGNRSSHHSKKRGDHFCYPQTPSTTKTIQHQTDPRFVGLWHALTKHAGPWFFYISYRILMCIPFFI